MILAMIILALKDSYLSQRPGKDNRTKEQNVKAKQVINDIVSHQKGLFKPHNDLSDWDVCVTITWITIL